MVTTIEEPQIETNHNHEPAAPAPERATNAFRIAPADLGKAMAGAAPEQAESLQWFARYVQIRNMPRNRVAALLRKPDGSAYSIDSVYQTLTGRRSETGSSIGPIVTAIEAFRRTVEQPQPIDGFVETSLFHAMHRYCERVRKARRIGFVFGDMNVGKSECAQELMRRDPTIIGFRMPTRGHLNRTLQIMAGQMAMGARQTVNDLSERIIEAIPRDGLLLVDEFDQVFSAVRNVLGLTTADFFRELYDRRRCGMVFILDHHGRNELRPRVGEKATGNQKRLQRLWRRRVPPLQLPLMPSEADLALFAARVGLSPAPNSNFTVNSTLYDDESGTERRVSHTDNALRLQRAVTRHDGLGVWLAILDDAVEIAREQRRTITWNAVIKAHAEFAAGGSEEGE